VAPAVGAVAAVALALGIIVGGGNPEQSKGATRSSHTTGSRSATVARRTLIATDTQSGTLGYADPETVFNRVSGTITWLPKAGTTVKPGQKLYEVNGSPIILMNGSTPAYRAFASGMADGPDVAELKQNLIDLGFDPGRAITVNDTLDTATIDAIARWQTSLGQTTTGTIPLGEVVFLSGSRRIGSVTGVLGSTGGGGSGSGASGGTSTGASYTVPPARPEFVSLTTTVTSTAAAPTSTITTPTSTTTTPTTPTTATPTTTPATRHKTTTPARTRAGSNSGPTARQLLQQLVAELKRSGTSAGSSSGGARSSGSGSGSSATGSSAASASSGSSSSSGGGGAATQIMTTTSSDLVVTVNLDATKQSEAIVGAPVSVQMPDGTTTNGRITAVSSVAQSSSSGSSSGGGGGGASGTPSATVPVTIALLGRHANEGLDQAAVSVYFQQQIERNVLVVPVTALVATAGGGYAVETKQNGQTTLIPVTPGLFAGGYVQVSGSQLVEGMQVSDSQG
jgi:hypothetical protein